MLNERFGIKKDYLFIYFETSLTLWPRLECSSAILAHCNLCHLGSHASASWVTGITSACHHAQIIFVLLLEEGFHHVSQAGLKLLTSSYSPSSASQIAGITGMSHCAWPDKCFFKSESEGDLTHRRGGNVTREQRLEWCSPQKLGKRNAGMSKGMLTAPRSWKIYRMDSL